MHKMLIQYTYMCNGQMTGYSLFTYIIMYCTCVRNVSIAFVFYMHVCRMMINQLLPILNVYFGSLRKSKYTCKHVCKVGTPGSI